MAEAHGLVVVLDDLHWADEATLALLSFLSRHVARSRVLIVGASVTSTPRRLWSGWTGGVEVVTLAGLADEEAADLADAVADGRLATDGVADVVRRAGGNPFVRELTRLVTAGRSSVGEAVHVPGGVRRWSPNAWPASRQVPRHARRRRRRRGGGAPRRPRPHVERASRPPRPRRRGRAGPDPGTPLDELAPLGFAHDLFREVLSAMLRPAIKAQLHSPSPARSTSSVPTASRSPTPPWPLTTSWRHHWARPAALEAVRHSQQAALDAAGQLAFEDAAGHLRRALPRCSYRRHPAAGVRLDLLLSLGVALDHAGDATEAREVLAEAADLARQLGDTGGFARAAIGTHRLGALSGLVGDHNVRLLEEASSSLAGQSSPLRARVLASLARELHHTWDPGTDDRAREVAVEAVDVARSLDDPSTLAYCLLALHDTSWSVGSAGERLPIVAEMLDLARLAGDRELHAQAQLLKATALLELGDPAAPAELERYCRAAEDLGHARGRWGALSRRAVLASWPASSTRPPGTPPPCSARRSANPTPGRARHPPVELARFRGGWSDFVTEGHWVPPGTWPPIRAVLLTARGDRPAAQSALAGYSLEQDRRHGVRRHDGWMPVIITEAGLGRQRGPAKRGVRLALPLAGHHLVYGGCMGYGGAVDHHLATLAAALGRHDDAVTHLRAALDMHTTSGPSPGPPSTKRCSPTT